MTKTILSDDWQPTEEDWDDYERHRAEQEPDGHAAFVAAMETDALYDLAVAA